MSHGISIVSKLSHIDAILPAAVDEVMSGKSVNALGVKEAVQNVLQTYACAA